MAEKPERRPVKGRRRESSGNRARRPKTNALQRHQRGREIMALRTRQPRPVAWTEIARRVGMSVSGAKDAYEQFVVAEGSMAEDARLVVDETIDVFTVALHAALEILEHAPPDATVRVQAIRAAMDAATDRLTIMRQAGRAPRSLAGPQIAQQMSLVFREFAELLRRHDVGDDALRELLELAESQAGRLATVDGREISQGQS